MALTGSYWFLDFHAPDKCRLLRSLVLFQEFRVGVLGPKLDTEAFVVKIHSEHIFGDALDKQRHSHSVPVGPTFVVVVLGAHELHRPALFQLLWQPVILSLLKLPPVNGGVLLEHLDHQLFGLVYQTGTFWHHGGKKFALPVAAIW